MSRKRKLPDGMWLRGKTYYARFTRGGRLIRRKLSSDFQAASIMLDDLRARAALGDYGILDNDLAWDEMKAEFLRWARQHVRRYDDYERALRRFESWSRPASARSITPEWLLGFREWRLAQGVTPRTVNKDVGVLGSMLNKAVAWKRIATNPIASIKPLPHDTLAKERRSLTVDEVKKLFKESPAYLKPVWRMFMTTGIRKGELISLRFSDVDWERRVITIRAAVAKSKKAREIPLDDDIFAELVRLRDRAPKRAPKPGRGGQLENFSREHVFVTKANTPWRNNLLTRFYTIAGRAGIEGAERGGSIDIHSLRVSFCTLAIEYGGNPKDVQAILGHSTLRMTMDIYSKATESGKRSVISALPFAKATAPDHVLELKPARAGVQYADERPPRQRCAQNSAQVSGRRKKPLKNRVKRA